MGEAKNPKNFRDLFKDILADNPERVKPVAAEKKLDTEIVEDASTKEREIKRIRDSLTLEGKDENFELSQRKELIDSIRIKDLPIGWGALKSLGVAVGRIEDRVGVRDLTEVAPPREVYPALPMVASVIANKRNPDIPIVLPTKDDVAKIKPWIEKVSRLINKLSPGLSKKFHGYVERRGEQVVMDLGTSVIGIAEFFKTIKNPRSQLLREVSMLYSDLQKSIVTDGLFGSTEVGIESKISWLLNDLMINVRSGGSYVGHEGSINKKDFPLILSLLAKLKLPPANFDTGTASIAGAELMGGIEVFLRKQNVPNVKVAPRPSDFDIFDVSTWVRVAAETFAADRLKKLKDGLPDILECAYYSLPEDGEVFAESIYDIAENVCALAKQGHTPEEIAKKMFER